MSFLNDKKNLPIIIGVAAVVVIGAVGSGLYFSGVIGGSSQAPVVAANPTGASYPGAPTGPGMAPTGSSIPGGPMGPGMSPNPGMPGAPGMAPGRPGMPGAPARPGMGGGAVPGLARVANGGPSAGEHGPHNAALAHNHKSKLIAKRPGGAPGLPGAPGALPGAPGALPGAPGTAGTQVASTAVVFVGDPTVGPDPFYTKPPPRVHLKPNVFDINSDNTIPPLPPITDPNGGVVVPLPPVDPGTGPDQAVVNDTLRRVSGILHSTDGVYAVLETNGVSQTVQPGDDVGGAKVVAIQDDGVTLKTSDNITLHVPLADTASVVTK